MRAWVGKVAFPPRHLRSQIYAHRGPSWLSHTSLGSSAHLAKWDLSFSICKVGKIVATSHGWRQNLMDPAWGLHPMGVRLLPTVFLVVIDDTSAISCRLHFPDLGPKDQCSGTDCQQPSSMGRIWLS